MYSVLIVDDFPYDQKTITDMVNSFSDLPLCIIGMSDNGYEALEAVHNLQPDILICDVEMPNMNGIELANALRAEQNDAHIIFCSLYDKVHYLQAAIQLNCDGYLMKPVSRQELYGCLKQILLRLLDVKAQQKAFDSLRRAMEDNRMSLVKEFFAEVLMSHDFSTEYLQHRREQLGLGPDLRFRLALITLNYTETLSNQPVIGDSSVSSFHLYQSLKRNTGWQMPYYIVRINERNYAVIFCYTAGAQTAEETGRKTEQALNGFVSQMRSAGISITAAFGSQVSQIGEMRRQYELCRYRLNRRWQYGGDPVIFSDDAELKTLDLTLDMQIVRNELSMLLNMENDNIRRTAEEYVRTLLDGQPMFQQQMICYYLLGNVRCEIQADNLPRMMEKSDFESLFSRVMVLNSPAECMDFAINLITTAYNLIHENEKNTEQTLVERIKKFIRNSDLKNIHLRLIADHFSYSPNYLNHVFKLSTNMTILDYITICRIDRAKELFQSTNMRPSEVAEAVGYSHATYLSIVFKKQEGITPKEYMERCKV